MNKSKTKTQAFKNQCATLDSFNQLFKVYTDEGAQKIEAYEMCELMHVSVYGRRRFTRYQSFQNCLNNAKRRETHE
jgi:hypothetical protein